MRARASLLMVVAGCSFEPRTLDGDDASGSALTCRQAWESGTPPSFAAPEQLGELAATGFDQDPWLTHDELTIVFASERASPGLGDIFRATRTAIDQPFAMPERIAVLSGGSIDEGKAAFSAGFDIVLIASNAFGDDDLWYGTHTGGDITQAWTWGNSPRGGDVAAVNSAGREVDPWMADDALRLAFSRVVGNRVQIEGATRPSMIQPFAAPQILMSDPVASDSDPFLAFDDTLLVFASNRTDVGSLDRNLYFATRASASEPFGVPQPITGLATAAASENDPWLSDDGCRIYFTVKTTDFDHIFVARMIR